MTPNTDFEVLEHPADLLVRAYGNSIEGAFINAARAMYSSLFDLERVEWNDGDRGGVLEFAAEDLEGLLQAFLDELLYHFEVHRRMYRPKEASISHKGEGYSMSFTYDATATYNPNKHGMGTEIKAVTYHMMEVGKVGDRFYVQVLFDI